jgi:hypothetical protein
MSADSTPSSLRPNGSGAAALLAAGIGSLMAAIFAIAGDKSASIKTFFTFSKATGPLSGVTTSAILVWLVVWAILHARWSKRTIAIGPVATAALILLVMSVLLTFPPLADLL